MASRRLALAGALCPAILAAPYAMPVQAAGAPVATVPVAGIVFVPRSEDVIAAGIAPPASRIDASRVPTLQALAAQAAIQPYFGLPLSQLLIDSLREAISKYYVSTHRPFVSITVPKQDVTDGVVQVVVIEARLGAVSVAGNRYFDEGQYLGALHLTPGGPIDNEAMQADLDWINRNPFRHATAVAAAGSEPGTTDFAIRTDEKFPLTLTMGADNNANRSTGPEEMNFGFDWGNAFWRGDDFNYRYSTSPDFRSVQQHSANYTAYLPWRDTLVLSGNVGTSESGDKSVLSTTGENSGISARYAMILPGAPGFNHSVTVGFDFRRSNNDLLFGGTSVFPTTTDVDQFVLDYGGQLADGWGSTGFDATLVFSPGGLGASNSDAAFAGQQQDAKAKYAYVRIAIDRMTQLPEEFSWDSKLTLQTTTTPLLASEQLVFGGSQSVRGFYSQAATRDQGVVWQNELRAPTFQTGLFALVGDALADRVAPFLFIDFGAGRNRMGENTNISMLSGGVGFRYQVARYVGAEFTWGADLNRHGATGPSQGPQFNVQLTY